MITVDTRPLTPDELADLRRVLDRLLPVHTPRRQLMSWALYGLLGLFPLFWAIREGSLVGLLLTAVLLVAMGLLVAWLSQRAAQGMNSFRELVIQELESAAHEVSTVTEAEYLTVEAYGMQLWLVQCDYTQFLRVSSSFPRAEGPFPSAGFQLIRTRFNVPAKNRVRSMDTPAEVALQVLRPLGEAVAPLRVIGPQEYERIRHRAPDEGELAHGRLQALIELLPTPA